VPFQIVDDLSVIYKKILQNLLRLRADKALKYPHEIASEDRIERIFLFKKGKELDEELISIDLLLEVLVL
jgi:hypothetical protein